MKGYPVTLPLPVLWSDMDALGHVNNTRYFTWFESARIALFTRVGLVADAPSRIGPILATTTCDFLHPVTWPAEIVTGTAITRIGNTSFGMDYGIWLSSAPDTLVARGSGVVVIIDYDSGQKVPIPDGLRTALDGLTRG